MQKSSRLFDMKNPVFRYNFDILLICIALSAVGIHLNGIYALWQILLCTASAVISEFISFRLVVKKNTVGDLNAAVTGMLIALMLPVCAPFYVGICASVFAILVAKLPFGDVRNTPFVPPAAGFCFVSIIFTEEVFTYSALSSGEEFFFFGSEGFTKGTTLFDMLSKGDSLTLNVFGRTALLSGTYPGAIGTTSILALVGALCYLGIRHPKRIFPALGYISSAALFALLFPRVNSGRISSVIMELCAGGLIFTALFLITDPVTAPRNSSRAFIYGALGGGICMLLRYFSKTPDPSCFSVLIMNALWPVISNETLLSKKNDSKKALKFRASRTAKTAKKGGGKA